MQGRISEEIDIGYEEEREVTAIEEARPEEIERAEMDYYMQLEDVEETDSTIFKSKSKQVWLGPNECSNKQCVNTNRRRKSQSTKYMSKE